MKNMKKLFAMMNYNWKKLMLVSGIVFQLVFLLELLLFFDDVVVDPSVHIISYDHWKQVVSMWNPSGFWEQNSVTIITVVKAINVVFQLLFGIELIYIFVKSERFSLSRKKLILGYLFVVLIAVAFRVYIKYNVDFYRLYMYSIFTELVAVYMIWLSRYVIHSADGRSSTLID